MLYRRYRLRNPVSQAPKLHRALGLVLGATLLLSSVAVPAQDSAPNSQKNWYRVELLLVTLKNPADTEYLGQAKPPSIPAGAQMLYGQPPRIESRSQGQGLPEALAEPVADFDKDLLNADGLHLTAARDRLRRSGRYNIEFLVAWNQAFPPGHKTPPLLVQLGETKSGYSDIEGFIQIERQRYLHVNAQLYDLDLDSFRPVHGVLGETTATVQQDDGEKAQTLPLQPSAENVNIEDDMGVKNAETELQPEVVSWLRETRRMRSGEVHFLDSPTMGLLVYFEPLK